ncbi:MAG: glucosylglycerol 3-phosphatase [Phormidesmis sp. RL_2_1]|nr:glucosylglycerol 3-phosphatase [Phormidesmis sp. RL_2_1]
MSLLLSQQSLSLDHHAFAQILATTENLLMIQDLDGVCMGLVNDPLTRSISADYIKATQAFDPHFYVLTNGEHVGRRGMNRIVEQALAADAETATATTTTTTSSAQAEAIYLPGLAAGGVQWQSRNGKGGHPGVSDAELLFLKTIPQQIQECLQDFCHVHACPTELINHFDTYLASAILDNMASPSANLNRLYPLFVKDIDTFVALQDTLRSRFEALLAQAEDQGLGDSFFIHYAPNLGRDANGKEIVWFGNANQSGTTDFQFMLRGAIKEAGVLALLNHYYFLRTGSYPLGQHFNARQAPQALDILVDLATKHFDPAIMPTIVGVGDTITSQQQGDQVKRGGSDRNFLQLIQNLNQPFNSGNLTVYVDSSGGELKNRQPLKLAQQDGAQKVIQGPGDGADPLRLNVAFPGGHDQYCQVFVKAARDRLQTLPPHI